MFEIHHLKVIWWLCLAIVIFPVTSQARRRLFFGFSDNNELCQVLDIDFSISVTARDEDKQTSTRKLTSTDDDILLQNSCNFEHHSNWMSFNFTKTDSVLHFNFLIAKNKVYLNRRFALNSRDTFPKLRLKSEKVDFQDPNFLKLGRKSNSYNCQNKEKASYENLDPDNSTEGGDLYTVEVSTNYIHAQAFGLDQSPSGTLGAAVKCEDTSESYDGTTAALVSSAVGAVILVLVVAAAVILRKHRREYDTIDDD